MPLSRILPPRRRSMLSSTPTTSGWPFGTNAVTSRPSRIREPCRPDHATRERNRWNRLKPWSDAPSTARRAAQTVRRFRHSNAPVASATAFNHVGCVNSAANGASQVSIARAFSGCAIFATIGFPCDKHRGKRRSCLQNLQIPAQAADYGDTTEQPGKPPKSRLEHLTQPADRLQADDICGEGGEGEVDVLAPLVADGEAPEAGLLIRDRGQGP